MSRRWQRFIILFLTIVPATVFVIISLLYVISQVRTAITRIDILLVEEVERQTGRAVEVGRLDVSALGTARIHDLRIADGPTFDAGTLLTAREVVVSYGWSDLLWGRVPAIQAIDSVRVVEPVIRLERLRTGKLNISDLFVRRPGPPRPPFTGVIDVERGRVVFRDWLARVPGPKPVAIEIISVEGTFDASNFPFYVYNLTGRGRDGRRFDRLAVSGSIDNDTGIIAADIRATNAAAAFWSKYFVAPEAVTVQQGRSDVTLTATGRSVNNRRVWSYAGSASLRDGRVAVVGLNRPATGVRGNIGLSNETVSLRFTGGLSGTPFTVNGTLKGFARPVIDLRIASESADFRRLKQIADVPDTLQQVNLAGRGPLSIRITGPSDDLAYAVRTTVPRVQAFGYNAANLAVSATYANGVVDVERASARALNGVISASGAVVVAGVSPRLSLSGTASGVRLDLIPELRRAGMRGTGSGQFSVTGTAASPRLAASVQVRQGIFNKVAFRDARALIVVVPGTVTIRSLSARAGGGSIRLAGSIVGERVDLWMVAAGVNLARILAPFDVAGVTGTANFQGRITGPATNPTVTGSAEVFEGRFRDFQFDYARGRLVATRRDVALEDAVVRVVPAEITLQGTIVGIGTRTPTADLQVAVAEAPIERILSQLRSTANVRGTITGTLSIRGTAPDIRAEGVLRLTDGSVGGYPVAEAEANVAYAGRVLDLTNLTARSDGATFAAEGQVDLDGNLAFTFAANNVSLQRLSEQTAPYAVLSGNADMTGSVSGTADDLNVDASIIAVQPVINTVQFDRFSAELRYEDPLLAVTNVRLESTRGTLSFARVAYDSDAETLAVEGGDLRDFSVPALYTLIEESPYVETADAEGLRTMLTRLRMPESGVVSATFAASGPVDNLQGNIQLSGQNIDIAELQDAQVKLEASARRGLVTIDTLDVTADSLNIAARGTVVPGGNVDVEVDAYNVDLGALTTTVGPSFVSGTATIRASVQGPIETPVIIASAEMIDPVIYGVAFDRLRASQMTVQQDTIDISRVLVTRGDHSGILFGTLPWSWATLSIPADRPIDLHATMEQQTLGLLAVLSDRIVADRTSGDLSANLDITGTLGNPALSGQIQISNGTIGIRDVFVNLVDVQADLRFTGDEVLVDRFSGRSDAGGDFEIVPGGVISIANLFQPVSGQPLGNVNLTFRTRALNFTEENLFGYQERVSGEFTTGETGITIVGPILTPLIAGQVVMDRARIRLSPVSEPGPVGRIAGRFNPTFNLTMNTGDDVWFSNRSLSALIHGNVQVTGALQNPTINARVDVASGWLRFPTQRMRITRGVVTLAWTPFAGGPEAEPVPARIIVDLSAQTAVSATSPFGDRRRYNILLNVSGPLLTLSPENIDLTSDPPGLSRPQILAALGHFEDIFGNGELSLNQQLRDILTVAVSPLLFEPLESEFIEALGLEDFSIEYGFEQPLAVFLSRRLFEDVYLSYWRIVTGSTSNTGATYSLRLSYRLREWLELGFVTDSTRANIIEAAYRRRF